MINTTAYINIVLGSIYGSIYQLLFLTTLGNCSHFTDELTVAVTYPRSCGKKNKPIGLLKVKGEYRAGNMSERRDCFKENLGSFFPLYPQPHGQLRTIERQGGGLCEAPSTREVKPQRCNFGDSCSWFEVCSA